ncbi:MAG: hypothetical protein A2908_04395 [Candidatus Staskawiczbacteria bacterium RIFCSPLOWO2_01_FULL_38_12b]|uniref:Uncharacterized protein n=1 Tax=Candidatus Staskawiczbacteria bacterium RIFCSPLOWO2_01_FULL_38_12b TaxID=1802214 RepID=A0A1G2IBH3_9BACT|nr:MAG: hypothetical protein A2908_04395 [Candidatus Staskawiczbacteria bacterium RIFCSPLOWO2_01_FULL_38_12b]
MTTKALQQKTNELEKELALLRSFVIGQFGRDPEGEYNPNFVKEILKAAKGKPKYEFKDADSFLKHIRGK